MRDPSLIITTIKIFQIFQISASVQSSQRLLACQALPPADWVQGPEGGRKKDRNTPLPFSLMLHNLCVSGKCSWKVCWRWSSHNIPKFYSPRNNGSQHSLKLPFEVPLLTKFCPLMQHFTQFNVTKCQTDTKVLIVCRCARKKIKKNITILFFKKIEWFWCWSYYASLWML